MSSETTRSKIKNLLPHGGQQKIARELGISKQAVSLALKKAKPTHPAVLAALKIIKAAGIEKAAKSIQQLSA